MFGLEFMERCPAQAAQEKPQLLIFLRPKDISDESLRLYIYTISTSDDLVQLIQMRGKQIKFGEIPNYPRQLVYYKIGITNETCVLELDSGQNLKLPNYVLVPITQIRMFRRIVKSNYKIRLYIGNGIY